MNFSEKLLKQAADSQDASYQIALPLQVRWGDMDAFRHVNNTVYFRHFESVRMFYFDSMGILPEHRIGPILQSTQCRFKAAVKYPDMLVGLTRVTEIQSDRFVMNYRIWSQELQRNVAEGIGTVVSYDYERNHKAVLPEFWRDSIQRIDGPLT